MAATDATAGAGDSGDRQDISFGQNVPADNEIAPATQALPLNELAAHAEAIRHLGKLIIADVIEIGRRLDECKHICGHGNWLPWLDREFGWDERTARRFISVYKLDGKSNNLSDLSIGVSSLYLLASPSTPEPAVDEVITRAEAGEAMSVSTVKQIVEDAKDADADGKARPRRGGWSRERWRRHKEKKRHQAAERGAILVDVVNQTLQRMDLEILELQTESVATGGDDEMAAHKGKMAEHATVNGTPPAVIKELIAETTTEKAVIKTPAIEIVGELLKDIDPDEIVKVMPTALRDRLRDLALKTLPPWRLVEEFRRRIPSCKPKTTAAADNLWARMNIEGLGP